MRSKLLISGAAAAALCVAWACDSTEKRDDAPSEGAAQASLEAWSTIYAVLQHPRCVNCHPSDGIPRQGEDFRPHAQLVQGGPDGRGRFAQRCDACHQTANLPGAHQPPGAPNWHLPPPHMPLVFAGKTPTELCEQMKDPARNGGRSPERVLEHLTQDPLVLWGWAPGEGRPPVSTPHAELLRAMRTWIDGGCGCP
jgi:hypothetical protein